MSKQEFQGKTLDEALSAAAKALGTDVTQLSYNILPQSSGGLFAKLFQKGVRLEAWVDSTHDVQAAAREAVRQAMTSAQDTNRPTPRAPGFNEKSKTGRSGRPQELRNPKPSASSEPRGERPSRGNHRGEGRPQRAEPQPRPQVSGHEEASERTNRPRLPLNSEQSIGLLKEIAVNFTRGFDPESTPSPQIEFIKEDEVVVSVSSAVLEDLLIKSDRLSCAFEHLFKRIAQKRFADISGRVLLNAGSAAQKREDKLREMALDAASRVRENGKTITLSSKSSQERRVIHLALENMEGIATKSVGMGENRKLIVFSTLRPAREPRDQNRRQRDGNNQSDGGQRSASSESGNQPRRSRRRGRHAGPRQNRRNDGPSPAPQEGSQSQKDHDSFDPHQAPEV